MEELKMEKLTHDAQYNDVVAIAKQMGLTYIGKKKPIIIEMINAKIDAGETVEIPAPVDQNSEAASQEGTEAPAGQTVQSATTAPAKRGRQASTTPREPRVKQAKWFDEEGANLPYAVGDIVEITGGEILINRRAQMTKYSAKKDAIKCILIHPVKGTLQGCEITMDFWKIKKADDQTNPANVVASTPVEEVKEPAAIEEEVKEEVVAVDEQPVINAETEIKEQEEQEKEMA
jgi:hypothetical protein